MNNVCLQAVYNGFVINQSLLKEVMGFFSILKNNKNTESLEYVNLFISSDNKNRAISFAEKTIQAFTKEKICYSYKIITSEQFVSNKITDSSFDDVFIVDDFDSQVKSIEIFNKLEQLHKIVVFCTHDTKKDLFQEDLNIFNKYFVKSLKIPAYTLDSILSGTHYYFDALRNEENVKIEDSFYPALDKYITTIYSRSILKEEEFVIDLKNRILKVSYEKNTNGVLSSKTIPYYREKEKKTDIEKDIQEYFCYCSDIEEILQNVSRNYKAKQLQLETYKPSFNIAISSVSFEKAEKFARSYANLLNTEEYDIVHAKDLYVMNLYDFMREKDTLSQKHGVILLKDFSYITEIENVTSIVKELIKAIDTDVYDVVWILHGKYDFDKYVTSEYAERLDLLFRNTYDLDKHTEKTSEEYIHYVYSSKNLTIPEDISELVKDVNEATSYLAATKIIEEYIVQHINDSVNPKVEIKNEEPILTQKQDVISEQKEEVPNLFDSVIAKEEELKALVTNIENPSNELNILLLAMSTIPKTLNVNTYHYKEISGTYVSQLEPVPKALTELLSSQGEKLDAIYVLNTNKTKKREEISSPLIEKGQKSEYSPFEYFKERCARFIQSDKIISIDVEKENGDSNTENAIYTFSQEINIAVSQNKKVNVYVDIHGGFRDTFTIVDALLMLIKDMQGVTLKNIFAVQFDNRESIIKSSLDDFGIFDFVSGMKEFLNYGRSNGLVEFNKNRKNTFNYDLVNTINSISDSILLNRTANFENNLQKLAALLDGEDKEKGYYDTVKNLISEDYNVTINGRQIDVLSQENIYFPALLQWCVNKKLYQQALTLIENNTARILGEQGLLKSENGEDIKEIFDNWLIGGLCTEVDGAEWYLKPEGVKESFKKNEYTKYNDDVKGYFKTYKDYFNDIKILENSDEEVIKRIEALREKVDCKKYLKYYKDYKDLKNVQSLSLVYCFSKISKKTRISKYSNGKVKIPVEDVLLNNDKLLQEFYIILYLCKGLKKYRNTVAHPKDPKKDLKIEEVDRWLRLLISRLDQFFRNVTLEKKTNKIKMNNTNKKEDPIDIRQILKKKSNEEIDGLWKQKKYDQVMQILKDNYLKQIFKGLTVLIDLKSTSRLDTKQLQTIIDKIFEQYSCVESISKEISGNYIKEEKMKDISEKRLLTFKIKNKSYHIHVTDNNNTLITFVNKSILFKLVQKSMATINDTNQKVIKEYIEYLL